MDCLSVVARAKLGIFIHGLYIMYGYILFRGCLGMHRGAMSDDVANVCALGGRQGQNWKHVSEGQIFITFHLKKKKKPYH